LKILITLEDHLLRLSSGRTYTRGPAAYSAWSELLDAFDEVVLLARVIETSDPQAEQDRVDGPSVSVHGLPNYNGPWEYLRKVPSLKLAVRKAVADCDAYLLRVPGLVGRLTCQEIRRAGRAYAAQVVGDPTDALNSGSVRSFFRPLYRFVAIRNLRKVCKEASAILYCSRESLPQRYPPAKGRYSAFSPWVILTEGYASSELMAERHRRIDEIVRPNTHQVKSFLVGFIGSFAQLYKGADTLLRAALICSRRGLQFRIIFVGEGRYRSAMESLAASLSIQEKVSFLGHLSFGKSIFEFLDSIDLYLMPSRAEAFGRSLLEAMARGCPSIGSNVGGIAELLAPEDLVPPNDPEALAQKIMEVTANPERMKAMSERNLARAKQFDPEVLREARLAFYKYVRDHSVRNAKSSSEQQSSLQPL